jgi:hypothetical protein
VTQRGSQLSLLKDGEKSGGGDDRSDLQMQTAGRPAGSGRVSHKVSLPAHPAGRAELEAVGRVAMAGWDGWGGR